MQSSLRPQNPIMGSLQSRQQTMTAQPKGRSLTALMPWLIRLESRDWLNEGRISCVQRLLR